MTIPTVDDVEGGSEEPKRKRKAARSFAEDATDFWRKLGCVMWKAEHKFKNPAGRWFTRDGFGFADYLVVGDGIRGTLYLQITDRGDARDHLRKIASIKEARKILESNDICVQSFDKNNESKLEMLTTVVGGFLIETVEVQHAPHGANETWHFQTLTSEKL